MKNLKLKNIIRKVITIGCLAISTLSNADYVEMVDYHDDNLNYTIPTYGLYYGNKGNWISMPNLSYCRETKDCKLVAISTDVLTTGYGGTHPATLSPDWEFRNGANKFYPENSNDDLFEFGGNKKQYISRSDLSIYNVDYFTEFRPVFAQTSFGGNDNNQIIVTKNDITIAYLVKSHIRLADLVISEPSIENTSSGESKLSVYIQPNRADNRKLLNLEISHVEAKFTPILDNGTLDLANQFVKIIRPNNLNYAIENINLAPGSFKLDVIAFDYAGEKSNFISKTITKSYDNFLAPTKGKVTSTYTSKTAQIVTSFLPPKKTKSGMVIQPGKITDYVFNVTNPRGDTAKVIVDNSGDYIVEWSNGEADVLTFTSGTSPTLSLKGLNVEGTYNFKLAAAHQTASKLVEGDSLSWSAQYTCTEVFNKIRCPSSSMKSYILKSPASTSIKRKVVFNKLTQTSQINVSWKVNRKNLNNKLVPLNNITSFCIQFTLPDGTESTLIIPANASNYSTKINVGNNLVDVIASSNLAGSSYLVTIKAPPKGEYRIGIAEIFNNGSSGDVIGVKSASPVTKVK